MISLLYILWSLNLHSGDVWLGHTPAGGELVLQQPLLLRPHRPGGGVIRDPEHGILRGRGLLDRVLETTQLGLKLLLVPGLDLLKLLLTL